MEKKNEQVRAGEKEGLGLASGLAANAAQANQQAATREVAQGMEKVFLKLGEDGGNNPNKFGNLFEAIEATKFNREAAIKSASVRAEVTAKPLDPNIRPDPHAKADIHFREAGKTIGKVQAKAYGVNEGLKTDRTEGLVDGLRDRFKNGDYKNMDLLVPNDKEGRARELLKKRGDSNSIYNEEYNKAERKLTGELKRGDVHSGGTTTEKLRTAQADPKMYAFKLEIKEIATETLQGAAIGVATGGLISIAITSVRNGFACHRGDKTAEEALTETAMEGAKGALRGGAVGGGGALIRGSAEVVVARGGGQIAEHLTKSNIATTIATASGEAGVIIYDFVRGEIGMAEAAERLGQNTIATAGSFYFGAAGGSIALAAGASATFAAGAAIAGSVAGYMLASFAYQTCMAIKTNANLAENEAARIEILVGESIKERDKSIKLMEEMFAQYLNERRQKFTAAITALVKATDAGDHGTFYAAMTEFTVFTGKELKLESFAEFDNFMMNSDEPLRI